MFFSFYILELTYFPSKEYQILPEWLNISGIYLSPDDHILHLVFHIMLSQHISLSWSFTNFLSFFFPPISESPSHSGYLPFHRGPRVTLLIVFFWMTLKDNGSLEPWPALSVCESATFHREFCPPVSREVMWSLCHWRGFPPLRVRALKRGVYLSLMRVSAHAAGRLL